VAVRLEGTHAYRWNGVPTTLTMDGSDANAAALKSSNAEHGTASMIRRGQYRKNAVEQDHKAVKWVTFPMLEFKAFEVAQAPRAGIALMPRITKSPCVRAARDEGLTATA
jgi:transposase-like protein